MSEILIFISAVVFTSGIAAYYGYMKVVDIMTDYQAMYLTYLYDELRDKVEYNEYLQKLVIVTEKWSSV